MSLPALILAAVLASTASPTVAPSSTSTPTAPTHATATTTAAATDDGGALVALHPALQVGVLTVVAAGLGGLSIVGLPLGGLGVMAMLAFDGLVVGAATWAMSGEPLAGVVTGGTVLVGGTVGAVLGVVALLRQDTFTSSAGAGFVGLLVGATVGGAVGAGSAALVTSTLRVASE